MPAFPATGMPVPEVWAKDGIDGISKKQLKRINSSAERVEIACVAAGNDLPVENIDARS